MESSLREKLILLIVDKLFLAIVLAMVGYALSLELESFKAVEARKVEVTKRGFEALEKVWTQFRQLETTVQTFTAGLHEQDPKSADFANQARNSRVTLENTISDQEIWLPKSSVKQLRNSLNELGKLENGNMQTPSSQTVRERLIEIVSEMKEQLLNTPESQ
jgi:hypothetical protein